MRKGFIIAGSIAGVIILAIIVVLAYAASNLNSIIANNRDRVLARISQSLGRNVQVDSIKAVVGWGAAADLTGVRISDDPDFSSKPFVQASNAYAQVELLPLLMHRLQVRKVVLENPEIRIVRNSAGMLNVMTIGKKKNAAPESGGKTTPERKTAARHSLTEQNKMAAAPKKKRHHGVRIESLYVHDFSVQQGEIVYQQPGRPAMKISNIDFDVDNFNFNSPFDIDLKLAALDPKTQNVELSGTVGPLLNGSAIDPNAVAVNLTLKAGPFTLAEVRDALGKAIPAALDISDSVNLSASVKGRTGALQINAATDLSHNTVSFGNLFNKPPGTTLRVDVDAQRGQSGFGISLARITLGDAVINATRVSYSGAGISGRLDSNRFAIGSLSRLSAVAQKFGITGMAEIHADFQYAGGVPSANGVLTLNSVAVSKPGSSPAGAPAVSALSGDIKFAEQSADIGPLTFKIGTGSATLKAHASRIYPPALSYDFTASALQTADFVASRPAAEQLNNVRATGTFALSASGPDIQANIASLAGVLNNVAYQNLSGAATLKGKQARVTQFSIGAFGGRIDGAAQTQLAQNAPFSASVTLGNVDVQQALASQQLKAADMIRGILSGTVNVSGQLAKFDSMKQTLKGNGQLALTQGKLVNINVASTALKKIDKVPMIGKLIPNSVVNNHPELFNNPDTDIQSATMSFVLNGPRITSHDILIKNVDYWLTGDGWFDMDRNLDMSARILLSPQFSREIVQQNSNVAYVANRNNQIDIPLKITGQLPRPVVVPDVGELAQRAGERALKQRGSKALGKLLGKKGLGQFLGGGGSNDNGGGGNSGGNPINNLKKLF